MSLLPLLTIPLSYILAQYPHSHAMLGALKGDVKANYNPNPSGSANQAALRKRLNERELAAFERAKACHRNALENMPIVVAAIFAGLWAQEKAGGQDVVGVRHFAVGWLVLRVVYTVNYLTVETRKWSFLRSAVWAVSVGWACVLIGRAAFV